MPLTRKALPPDRRCTSVQNCFAQCRKFAKPARIAMETKMLTHHTSMICKRPLGRIDNVALNRWAFFTVE